jgi:hypothetical protein
MNSNFLNVPLRKTMLYLQPKIKEFQIINQSLREKDQIKRKCISLSIRAVISLSERIYNRWKENNDIITNLL